MFNIKLNAKDEQSGKIVYNAGIVYNIVALAVAEVDGALPLDGKKNGISLFIEKDGIYVDVSVVVKYGFNVPELAYRIQQSVKQSVENMTHYHVAEVDVHVRDVVFPEGVTVEKDEEPAEDAAENNK
ncbi:MAG: Asp23/Gls24 family envelope stress response protein [Clostridia bacterium]|nr:Asp23/Gls24 family envelope stress response protein [Clostridia bacterium]